MAKQLTNYIKNSQNNSKNKNPIRKGINNQGWEVGMAGVRQSGGGENGDNSTWTTIKKCEREKGM